jgi:formate dehydrogenase subunit delta
MNSEQLITMANQIGVFFASMPDHDAALADVADHIRRFWDPRMRVTILAALDEPAAAETMAPIVREALTKARVALTPAATA